MACGLEFQELASHNRFIQDLENEGYCVDYVGNYVVIRALPYLDEQGNLKHGDWASPVDLGANNEICATGTHQAWFRGTCPYDQNKQPLPVACQKCELKITDDLTTQVSFSLKLKDDAGENRAYQSFEEKVRTYVNMIAGPAEAKYLNAREQGIKVKAEAFKSALKLPDTLSARYHINDKSSLLRDKSVAIVGLGGTGAYVLDFLARTHLQQISLFDDEPVHVHTLFRWPGFIANAVGKKKVDALAQHYGNWHSAIDPNPEQITTGNIDKLGKFDFVFVSVDHGPSRVLMLDWLSKNNIAFVDCGMGLIRCLEGLNGTVRITGVDRVAFDQNVNSRFLPDEVQNDEYRKFSQIAELNALTATLAVLRFKQHVQFFERVDDATAYVFETASFDLEKVKPPQ